jgi:hypothetical protein
LRSRLTGNYQFFCVVVSGIHFAAAHKIGSSWGSWEGFKYTGSTFKAALRKVRNIKTQEQSRNFNKAVCAKEQNVCPKTLSCAVRQGRAGKTPKEFAYGAFRPDHF